MRLFTEKTLKEFAETHPDALTAIQDWVTKAKAAEWSKPTDLYETFSNVSFIANDRYVFNIKGNDYRLVVLILFKPQFLYIRFIGTHREYDNVDCSTI